MYCLKVVIACPCYKRPYAHVIVEHFKDEELVKSRLNEIKLEYIENHNIEQDGTITYRFTKTPKTEVKPGLPNTTNPAFTEPAPQMRGVSYMEE